MLGFFSKAFAIDDMVSAGSNGSPKDFFTYVKIFNGLTISPMSIQWNIGGVEESNPDLQSKISASVVSYDGSNINGRVTNTPGSRGFRFSDNTARQSVTNRYIYLRAEDVEILGANPNLRTRTGPFDISQFINLRELTGGNNGAGAGAGNSNFAGIVGFGQNLRSLAVNPVGNADQIPLFTTIQYRFGERFEQIHVCANGIASIICDRLLDAVNLKKCYLGLHQGSSPFPASSTVAIGGAIMQVIGHLNLAHCPLLEELAFFGSTFTTDLTLNPSAQLKVFKAAQCTALSSGNPSNYSDAIDIALGSSVLERFIIYNSNHTLSRNIEDADIATTLSYWATYANIWTGDIYLTSVRPVTHFLIGNNITSITNPSLKNDHSVVDISGLTAAVSIDLSNSRITDLTLPVALSCTILALGGNKLDYTVNSDLNAQISALISLVDLQLSAGAATAANIENGQNSTNGLGPNWDLSGLTSLTTLVGNNCKLTGALSLPSSLINVTLLDNNLSSISGLGSALRVLRHSNNTVNFDYDSVRNIVTLYAVNTGQVSLNLANRSINTALNVPTIQNNASLTSITFPSNPANAVLDTNASIMSIINNPLLTTLNNLSNVTHLGTGNNLAIQLSGNAFDFDFGFGRTGWRPDTISLQNNGMSNASVNANITSIYTNRRQWDVITASKGFNISGTNAAPSGTYQAPSGYKNASITGITKASTAVVTVSSIGSLANNDVIRIRNVGGMTQVNQMYFMIKNISGDTFQLYNEAGTTPIDSSAFATYTSGGACYVEGAPASEKEMVFVLANVYAWTITMN